MAGRASGHLGRPRRRNEQGQVLIVFALAIVVLMVAAGLAFDVGRFYSEKRFLQNAADAGALAAANALIRGEDAATAEAEARDVLARNFLGSPTGSNPQLPPAIPVYEVGHPGDPEWLINGILISGGEVRVAVQSDVSYTFGRAAGLTNNIISGQARVATNADMLPIAVRHYVNAPGPNTVSVTPCDPSPGDFQDLIATANTACLGTETNAALRTLPNPGLAFDANNPANDPANHGPIIALVGQGATPSNTASFRGFISLDIRNFSSVSSNVFYNGVTAGMNVNTLKDIEAAWVLTGYPGPDFPPVTTPPDPDDQVGIIEGNSTGVVVDAINARYVPGDEIMAAVYSGTVMTIPDFSITVPSTVAINSTQNRDNLVTMSVSKNNAFTGTVDVSAFTDWGDPANPYGTSLSTLTFNPDPTTPASTVTWATFNTTSAPTGIYTVWIQGHSPSPYLLDHYYPVAINIGGVNRDFSSPSSGTVLSIPSTGLTATGSVSIQTTNNGGTYFNGDVTVSIEGGAASNGVIPTGLGPVSVTPSTFTLDRGVSQTVNLSINGGTLGPGEYPLTLRVTGVNQNGQPVTRLIPIVFDIATASTANEYVDILGFAVFRITCTPDHVPPAGPACPVNSVEGYAITGVYADQNDPALRRGQLARLVPWN